MAERREYKEGTKDWTRALPTLRVGGFKFSKNYSLEEAGNFENGPTQPRHGVQAPREWGSLSISVPLTTAS